RSDRSYAVDLRGTAHVLDAFLPIATTGTVAVMIASMAAEIAGLTPDQERQVATAPTPELLSLVAELPQSKDAGAAYCVGKRGNQLRVQAAAPAWGKRGARVVSISPGIISTPMGLLEMNQPMVVELLKIPPAGRSGTAEDIAAAA